MQTPVTLLWTAFLSFLPISELRGAIPFALIHGIPLRIAYPFAVLVNALVAPVCYLFLATLHKLFLRMSWYQNCFERFVEGARKKLHNGVEKWGWFGVALFVALPLPMTGAWTGTLGAWVLGLSRKKTMIAVLAGVIISGAIVSGLMMLGSAGLQLFTNKG
jgi:uncharacterized membrane protein